MNWRTFLILLWLAAYGLVGLVVYQRGGHVPSLVHDVAIGCAVAAVGLVAAWLVFGGSPFAFRASVALVGVLVFSLLLSMVVHTHGAGPAASRGFWLLFALHATETLAASVVMATMRRLGLRLQKPQGGSQGNEESVASLQIGSQFSLATLLTAVGCAAALMGGVRWAASLDSSALEVVWMGAVLGGFAVLAVGVVGARGFVILRCAATGFAMVTLVIGSHSPNIRVGFLVDISLPMWFFMIASLVVFRVCGYRLERTPSVDYEPSGVGGRSAEEPASTAMPAESRL